MFIELTKSGTDEFSGAKMLIPLDYIATISDNLNKSKDQDNTYIRLKSNTFFFVREKYEDIVAKMIKSQLLVSHYSEALK